jgi:hypothetical protein
VASTDQPGSSGSIPAVERWGAWPARVGWVLLALGSGGCLTDALDGRSPPVRAVAFTLLAAAWVVGLVALFVPRATSLTAIRVVVPAGLVAMAVATVAGDRVDGADVVAVALAALTTGAALAPWVAEAWIDGSSYGPERRLPLQTPVLVGALLAPLTWALVVAGAAVGPLLLAAHLWIAGTAATAVGALVVVLGVRSLHQLARRWIVLVPGGLVVHDPLTMPEPQLFPRSVLGGLRPAETDTQGVDLTAGASGLAVQLDLREPVDLLLRAGAGSRTVTATAILVTPARPAHLLAAARAHRIATIDATTLP